MSDIARCIPVSLGDTRQINCMTFDGSTYVATIRHQCMIVRLDSCAKVVSEYRTRRLYDCICYDWHDRCFWASSRTRQGLLYKLDSDFTEIDVLRLRSSVPSGHLTGLSYHCCRNTLLTSCSDWIFEIDKCTGECEIKYQPQNRGIWISDLCSLCTHFIILTRCNGRSAITVLDADFCPMQCTGLDACWAPRNILFNPCKLFSDSAALELLMVKHGCYPYLCELAAPVRCDRCASCCNFCKGERCDAAECRCTRQGCSDVLESIARVEASIAHILNAEGEKLQKVLKESTCLEEILCVNRHVNDTLISAAQLEQILYAKLHALSECGGLCPELPDSCRPVRNSGYPCGKTRPKGKKGSKKKTV